MTILAKHVVQKRASRKSQPTLTHVSLYLVVQDALAQIPQLEVHRTEK